ncbi:MAG: DUF1592 domain-containing protein [Polyangiales bacterium]
MPQLPSHHFVVTHVGASLLACALGCGGSIQEPFGDAAPVAGSGAAAGSGSVNAGSPGAPGSPGSPGSGVPGNPGSGTAGGGATSGAAGSSPPPAPGTTGELPARIRRLTNAEFDVSVKALLNIESTYGASFTPDTRQDGFTRNDAQRIDPVFITQLDAAAKKLSEEAKMQVMMGWIAQCQNGSDPAASETCARTFLEGFAKKAYRRPATPRELDALMVVYKAGAEGAAYADGLQLAIQAVLESPGFLYVTEIGETPLAPDAQLTDDEIASALAYLLTGGPPDDGLRQAAEAGELRAVDKRKQHAERLLASDQAKKQVTRMVQEWLGIDRITETAKDSTVYPEFAGLRDAMKREADEFVAEVMWKDKGSVSDLLAADWTTAEDGLARLYLGNDQQPQRTNNRVSLAGVKRRGILNQGAFLSVYAHAQETAPVLRGVAVLRRVACFNVPPPTSLNLNIVPPVADPTKTTRERFSIHSKDPACAACHNQIDAIGFSFEGLDGMGRARDIENGHPIDSATMVKGGFSFDGPYPDSAELALQLASSSELQTCFATHFFRNAAARNTENEEVEKKFLDSVAALPAGSQGKFADVLLAFVTSDLFITRRAP